MLQTVKAIETSNTEILFQSPCGGIGASDVSYASIKPRSRGFNHLTVAGVGQTRFKPLQSWLSLTEVSITLRWHRCFRPESDNLMIEASMKFQSPCGGRGRSDDYGRKIRCPVYQVSITLRWHRCFRHQISFGIFDYNNPFQSPYGGRGRSDEKDHLEGGCVPRVSITLRWHRCFRLLRRRPLCMRVQVSITLRWQGYFRQGYINSRRNSLWKVSITLRWQGYFRHQAYCL